ncbi:GTPase HflX [Planctomycetales bacterium]|nr:GTPase HflX [Planctomycetales bacterium]
MSSNNQSRHDRTELALAEERCFLVGAEIPGRYQAGEEPLSELAELIDTAGGEVVGTLTQKIDRPTTRYYLGKGKFYDLVDAAIAAQAETIVVDDDITPAQLSTIEEAARMKVIDRSEVILDIFRHRARSLPAQLQVELAQLQYELPRLARKWTHLERVSGGIGTGVGSSRGGGEAQIEVDRRLVRKRISRLQQELTVINERRNREVEARARVFKVCLVGYTNAGKSSLQNRLTGGEEAFVENRLFATLDTLTRQMTFVTAENKTRAPIALLSDTVGFIRRLPHHLVASFHATLAEAAQADLLLIVLDSADPRALLQTQAVRETLADIGMAERESLYVFNKIDLPRDEATLARLRENLTPAVEVSAQTGAGIDALRELIYRRVIARQNRVTLRFSSGDGRRLALINQFGADPQIAYDGDDLVAEVTLAAADLERLKRLPGEMAINN